MTTSEHGPSLAELARRIQDFAARLESIALRMETAYVTKEFFDLNNQLQNQKFKTLQKYADDLRDQSKEDIEALETKEISILSTRVQKLEEDKAWLVRLVFGVVIVGILGILFGSGAIGK